MRLVPLLTAIVVAATLYLAVFQRDALLAFARGEAAAPVSETDREASPEDSPAASVTERIGVVVLRSEAQQVDSAVILRGETSAWREVEVRAETSSTVISDPMRKGAFVQAGDLLCELDPGTRNATLAEARARLAEATAHLPEAEARLEEANARLAEARINFNAAEKLSKGGYASETRLVSTRATVRSAEAGIASARAGLESARAGIEAAQAAVAAAEREIDRLKITAPFDGILESDTAELGSLMQPGSLCATVFQLDPIKLVGYVPEAEVDRVKIGAVAGAELSTGARINGTVIFIGRSADPATRTFEVEIEVANPDLAIRDGQTAAIAIAAQGAMAHRLPQSALTLNNEGQLGVRIVDAANIVQFRPVELVRDDVNGVWVKGLENKADVIVVGQDFVTQGVAVDPTYREATR